MHLRRKISIIMITLGAYGLSIFFLYFSHEILESIPYLLICFVAIHFCVIELKDILRIRDYIIVLSALSISAIIASQSFARFGIASVILYNLALFFVIYAVHDETHNRKKISTRSIIHNGGYVFTFFITLAYITFSMATYAKFTLTCEELYSYSDEYTETFTKPFLLGIDQVEHIKEKISQTSTLSVKEFLGIESGHTQGDLDANKQDAKTTPLLMTPIGGKQETLLTQTGSQNTGGLLGKIENIKQRLVDQVMQDQDIVNNGICDFLITQIKDRFDKPVFQFSVIILLFLLLSPIVRIIIFIMEFISLAIIALLRITGIYSFVKKKERVEDIQ